MKQISQKTYGYARVSSREQNLDRQIDQLKTEGISTEYILCDKANGKDFNRSYYLSLVGTPEVALILREGDQLVICSLDRLGRNYDEIREQWDYITKTLKVDIKVLDIPLLDTSQSKDSLDTKFIADLVLQILCYTAQKEREQIRERQRQGIEAARLRGKPLGRPKAEYPENWDAVYTQWKNGEVTGVRAMELLNLKRTTFYNLKKRYRKENGSEPSANAHGTLASSTEWNDMDF